jgi:hypothetical protein
VAVEALQAWVQAGVCSGLQRLSCYLSQQVPGLPWRVTPVPEHELRMGVLWMLPGVPA